MNTEKNRHQLAFIGKIVSIFVPINFEAQMLEFKNTSVKLSNGDSSKPFSLVVEEGDIVCLCGRKGCGKSLIMRSILGLWPINSGFITYDGELLSPGSSFYFRKMTAYIPQDTPKELIKVIELFHDFFHLKSNNKNKVAKKDLLDVWAKLNLDPNLLNIAFGNIDEDLQQKIMVSFLPLLKRKIILIDNIHQSEVMQSFIEMLASSGSEVIYTCIDNKMNCNKLVNL